MKDSSHTQGIAEAVLVAGNPLEVDNSLVVGEAGVENQADRLLASEEVAAAAYSFLGRAAK